MKKILIIGAVLTLFLLILGAATNPSYSEYKEWYKSQMYEETSASTELQKSFTGFISDLVSDAGVVREDHKLYSLYKIETEDFTYKVLGAFNNFYVLEDIKVTKAVE